MLKTDRITYNVHDRGRKFRGVDRNFDTVALARLINSPYVQEQVANGDMLGYYGHWPRMAFGMATQEVGLVDGKVVPLPTAVRTTYLHCDDDGTITHQAEFLNNEWGRAAQEHFESDVGGFSSAIDPVRGTSPTVAAAFYGFDYVLEPNYTTNRGRALLDAVQIGEQVPESVMALLDAVMSDERAMLAGKDAIYDRLHAQHMQALQALETVSRENDMLIGRLAAGHGGMLDDVGRIPATVGGMTPESFRKFKEMDLTPLQELPKEREKEPTPDASNESRSIMRNLGFGGRR